VLKNVLFPFLRHCAIVLSGRMLLRTVLSLFFPFPVRKPGRAECFSSLSQSPALFLRLEGVVVLFFHFLPGGMLDEARRLVFPFLQSRQNTTMPGLFLLLAAVSRQRKICEDLFSFFARHWRATRKGSRFFFPPSFFEWLDPRIDAVSLSFPPFPIQGSWPFSSTRDSW